MAITDRAVDTHVFNLRKKIEPVPAEPRFLVGVRGLGYRFNDERINRVLTNLHRTIDGTRRHCAQETNR